MRLAITIYIFLTLVAVGAMVLFYGTNTISPAGDEGCLVYKDKMMKNVPARCIDYFIKGR